MNLPQFDSNYGVFLVANFVDFLFFSSRKALSAPLMVAVEMLFRAQDYVAENLSKSRYDLLGIVEFIVRVEVRRLSTSA